MPERINLHRLIAEYPRVPIIVSEPADVPQEWAKHHGFLAVPPRLLGDDVWMTTEKTGKPRRDPALRVLATLVTAAAAIGALGWLLVALPDEAPRPLFHCNGTTGVYDSRDGHAVVPEPYDPACR